MVQARSISLRSKVTRDLHQLKQEQSCTLIAFFGFMIVMRGGDDWFVVVVHGAKDVFLLDWIAQALASISNPWGLCGIAQAGKVVG